MARVKGRGHTKEKFWRRAMQRQAGSGLSIRAWCRRQHLREASFYWWRRQLARREAQAPALVPVRVTAERPGTEALDTARMEIHLPGAYRVCLAGAVDREALRDVLAVLNSMSADRQEAAAC
jgi:hypothetical protein